MARDPEAQEYYRLFLAPGGEHCPSCSVIPPGMKMMDIIRDWVEKGVPPETLPVVGESRRGDRLERNICMYPAVQHYIGGDMTKPSSFQCV